MLRYKAEKIESNFKDGHPNHIEVGFTFEGMGDYPIEGESFLLVREGRVFKTSVVKNIDKDKGIMETINSTYKITEVK
jgi:hypothetical protein